VRKAGQYIFPYDEVELHLHGVGCQQAWVDGARVECHEKKLIRTNIFELAKIEIIS
jgi:hypothetical protein